MTNKEREYFVGKIGAEPTEPLNNVKKRYFNSLGLEGTLVEQEKAWLRTIIKDNGKTPTSPYQAMLWQQAASALGNGSMYLSSNKETVFQNT